MRLINVYEHENSLEVLWNLMAEREPTVSISHRAMPTWDQHVDFVSRKPYRNWWVIETDDGEEAGACYVSKANEIGVFVLNAFRERGIGTDAVMELMVMHPGERLLSNVAPGNHRSIELFGRLGFRLIQHTFCLER